MKHRNTKFEDDRTKAKIKAKIERQIFEKVID
jgi:hypothetical protein